MSELDSRFVRLGLWTDLAKGRIMGQTITTDTRTGTFIISLVAILSSLAIGHLWNLVAFLAHQFRATGRPRHGLSQQLQALLRTQPTPSAFLADLFKLFWHWKKKESKVSILARVSLLMLLASIFGVMTWATSIFSSLVVDSTHIQVLVDSPYCGAVNLTTDRFLTIALSYLPRIVATAESITDNCYMDNNGSLPALCDTCESSPYAL